MPIDLIPNIKEKNINGSIYDYIEKDLHLKIQSAHRTVSVRKATDFEANELGLEKGDPVAVAEQVGYLELGHPHWGCRYGDRSHFTDCYYFSAHNPFIL